MATKTAKILHKRGIEDNMPTLEESELAYTTDTGKMFVGTQAGNKGIVSSNELSLLGKSILEAQDMANIAKDNAELLKESLVATLNALGNNLDANSNMDSITTAIKNQSLAPREATRQEMYPSPDADALRANNAVAWSQSNSGNGITMDTDENENTYYITGSSFFAKRSSDGKLVWSKDLSGQIASRDIAYINGVLFATSKTGITMLSTDGEVIEKHTLQKEPEKIVPVNDYLIVGHRDGYVEKISLPNYEVEWSTLTNSNSLSGLSVSEDGTIYAVSGKEVHRIGPDGVKAWSNSAGSTLTFYAVIYVDGYLYATANENYLRQVNPDNGELILKKSTSAVLRRLIKSEEGYFYGLGSYVMLFRAKECHIVWTNTGVASSSYVSDGSYRGRKLYGLIDYNSPVFCLEDMTLYSKYIIKGSKAL